MVDISNDAAFSEALLKLHPADAKTLQEQMRGDKRVKTLSIDG